MYKQYTYEVERMLKCMQGYRVPCYRQLFDFEVEQIEYGGSHPYFLYILYRLRSPIVSRTRCAFVTLKYESKVNINRFRLSRVSITAS